MLGTGKRSPITTDSITKGHVSKRDRRRETQDTHLFRIGRKSTRKRQTQTEQQKDSESSQHRVV